MSNDSPARHLVLFGLGNPGQKYAKTRHNIGYMTLQLLAREDGLSFKEEARFFSQVARGQLGGITVHLVLPQTYMNASGTSVKQYLDYYKLHREHMVVISDDVALPFGKLRLRACGGSGGHNGLKSVQASLESQDFVRLRMGIGEQEIGEDLAAYVLAEFNAEEQEKLLLFLARGVAVLRRLVHEELAAVMNDVNAS